MTPSEKSGFRSGRLLFIVRAGQIRPDYGGFVFRNVLYRALGNDRSAVRTRAATHFNEPVGFFQNLRVVVNQQD